VQRPIAFDAPVARGARLRGEGHLWQRALMNASTPTPPPGSGIAHVIQPHARDLGDGFIVARMLPAVEKRMVGPFVFLDQFGPVTFPPGKLADVRPHPHIGLATVTYMFAGEIMHRDNIGSAQIIRAGEVNWMTAGRGIAHSERTPDHLRDRERTQFGLQFWVGLPTAKEEMPPAFAHHGADELPTIPTKGAKIRLVVGALAGKRSPVVTASETLLVDIELPAGGRYTVPAEHKERAIQVVSGTLSVGGMALDGPRLAVLEEGRAVELTAEAPVRCVLFGGDPLDGPRHLWWNFVSSSKERIEQAKRDWKDGRFPTIPGETEFIPLPE
jgi:redox-sensitive bicupin YhaK (pirin superfamily)